MAKIEEATARMYKNVFVCKRCKHKQRANPQKIRLKKIQCRFCKNLTFRPKKKEKRAVA